MGLLVALVLLGAAAPIVMGWLRARVMAAVLGMSVVITMALLFIPSASADIAARAMTIPTAHVQTDLSGRLPAWEGSGRLLAGGSWFDFGRDRLSVLRPVVGYGPEMFRYVFRLESPAELHLETDQFYEYAHNYYLHEAVEMGLLGLLTLLGLLGAVFTVGVRSLKGDGPSHPDERRWLTLGLLAALVGWSVAAVVGIPRIGDLTLFWVLVALFVAMPRVFAPSAVEVEVPPPPATDRRSRVARRRRSAALDLPIARLLVALGVVGLLGAFTWVKNVNYLVASASAASALDALEIERFDEHLRLIDRSVGLAPDVAWYHRQRSNILRGYAQAAGSARPAVSYGAQAHESNLRAFRLNPLSVFATQAAALSAMDLVQRGQEEHRDEAVELFGRLTELMPQNFRAYELASHALWLLHFPKMALAEVGRGLALTGDRPQGARSHMLRGFFLADLERTNEAAAAVERALALGLDDRNDRSEAHRFLVGVYRELGDDERAELHLEAYRQIVNDHGFPR